MLPSKPQIFHGRNSELAKIVQLFNQGNPRIAILGAGGMGKTTLARALLHHTNISATYKENRYFVSCDCTVNAVQLAAHVGAHLGLRPSKNLTRAVVQYFMSSPPSFLILDNLDTVWEPIETCNEVEEFLSLLTDVEHLALIVTLRGAQRPAKVAWTHPFLPPLSSLEQNAARQMFFDIAADEHDAEEVDKVLALADNMPIAISLLAHLVDSEGSCSTVLSRWDEEGTSVISMGWDRKSNLDLSVSLSLSSPRFKAAPQAPQICSLLSILPNGLSDSELVESNLPVPNVLRCKTALIGTALAYLDSNKRVNTLVPIREYMQKVLPPTDDLIRPLRRYFQQLLEQYREYHTTSSGSATRISANFANIRNLLQKGLDLDHPDLVDCIYHTCYLSQFSSHTGQGLLPLMRQIPNVFPRRTDHRLEAYFATELLSAWNLTFPENLETVISDALTHLELCNDVDLKCRFYLSVAYVYMYIKQDLPSALKFGQAAVALAEHCGHGILESQPPSDYVTARLEA
ncbi:P-loop containing nucleoside triphosphate hydrolase protein [Mycena vitilis]|nr:P-loop containing nucleoside triphosphate hydrolase protein [Mycena vitilis]